MRLKRVLLSTVSWLAMTEAAQADLIFTPLTLALFAGPLGAIAGPAAIYAGLQVAAVAAGLALQFAFAPKAPSIDPGQAKNTFQEQESSEINGIGRVKVGGLKAFGNTKDQVIHRLIWHLSGEMVAMEEFYVGGYEVIVEPNGDVSSPPWALPDGSWLNIRSKIGDGTETAWPELIAAFPSLWTAEHRCRGIFQSHARYRVPDLTDDKFAKLYQGGAPDIEITARMRRIYDPRDPAHAIGAPDTWSWSTNGVLCAAHIYTQAPSVAMTDLDWALIAAEADKADQLVATRDGSEPRARCSGIWPSESKLRDVMQPLLDSIGAELLTTETGKVWFRLIDDARTPEVAYTEVDMFGSSIKAGPEAVERPNLCRVMFYSAEQNYAMAEIPIHEFDQSGVYTGPAWARVQSEIDAYGEKIMDIELPFCPSAAQAQRIARRKFLMARAETGVLPVMMSGLAAWGRKTISFPLPDLGETVIAEISQTKHNTREGRVDIPFVAIPEALLTESWNPATMEAPAPEVVPPIQYESVLDTPDKPNAAGLVQYPDLSYEFRILVEPVPDAALLRASYRTYTEGEPNLWQSMTSHPTRIEIAYTDGAGLEGERIDVRARFFDDNDEASHFSETLEIASLAIDNTATAAPGISGSAESYQITAPSEIHVSHIRVTESGVLGPPIPVRPGEVVIGSQPAPAPSETIKVFATAYTSDGTASPPSDMLQETAPPPGP